MKPFPGSPLLKLRTVFLMVNLVVLLLPLIGIHFIKLYENALVRQTESELISQAAFIAAAYKQEMNDLLQARGAALAQHSVAVSRPGSSRYYQPIPESLDLAREKMLPPRPAGLQQERPDPLAVRAGAKIAPILQEAQRITLSGMKVLDYRGVEVAGRRELGLSFAHMPEVRQALKGQPESSIRKRVTDETPPPLSSISRGAMMNVFVAMPILEGDRLIGVVLLNRTPSDLAKTLYSKRKDILLAAGLILLATLLMTVLTSYTVTRPIYALVRQARHIAEGGNTTVAPLSHPMTREVAELSDSFVTMARRLQDRSDYIRQFATHLSHEFKTPLTGIQGSVELLQEHLETMPPEQRDRFLNNIAQDTDRLKRLVNRLLEMARADMLEPGQETADILTLISGLAGRYRDLGLALQVENRTGHSSLTARISAEALEAVFSNLLDNSLQHGASRTILTLAKNRRMVTVTLADNGRGISEANRERIFTPFFTTQRANGGTGLGLSIIQALLKTHQGEIRLLPSDTGAVFEVALPAADPPSG